MLKTILSVLQIALPILLIGSILLQQKGTALGGAFGGSGESYMTRRGLEQKIFVASIILSALFILVSLLNLIVK